MEEPLTEEAELWLAAVEEEQRAIEALPFVKSVSFHHGDTANLCQVLATVYGAAGNNRVAHSSRWLWHAT